MSYKNFHLELVSPEDVFFKGEVSMAVIPAVEGMMGVLAQHAPMIVELSIGIVEIFQNGVCEERFFIGGGFADVLPEKTMLLAERVVNLKDLSISDMNAQIDSMTRTQAVSKTPSVLADAERRLLEARIIKAALDHGPYVEQVV